MPRVRGLTAAVAVLAAAAAGVAVWYFAFREPAAHPTAGEWTAVVSTIAGSGAPGTSDADALHASFSDPFSVAIAPGGSAIYVADAGDSNRIRLIASGIVTTLAGGSEGFADGQGGAAAFHTPSALASGPDGALYVADTGNHAIRRITLDGHVTTVAGAGRPGYRDGAAGEALFDGPIGLAVSGDGTVFVADTYNDRIRRIDPTGTVSTVAGSGVPGYMDGAASSAQFDTPCGIAIDETGALVIADTNNHVLRRLDLASGEVSSILPPAAGADDVSLFRPVGVAGGSKGGVFVTDRRGRILHVLADGRARLLAGLVPEFADGIGTGARFFNPTGIAVDAEGALLVADSGNHLVRRLAPAGLYPPDPPRSPLALAPGRAVLVRLPAPLPWPLDPMLDWHEVTGTMGEPRGNSGGDGRDRFHAGVDIRAFDGDVVVAVRDGKVDNPLAAQGYGTLNESLAVEAIAYVHLRVGRDPSGRTIDPVVFVPVPDDLGQTARIRVRRGVRFRFGQALGTVNRFSHVHLNTGPAGREVNPLLLGPPGFVDTVAPFIAPRGVRFTDEWGAPFPIERGRPIVSGRVRIEMEAWDQADGNSPSRRLGLFRAGYQVLDAAGRVTPLFEAPLTTLVFDRLPRHADAARLVYAEGSGIAGQGQRRTRYRYAVTNRLANGVVSEDFWDTRTLEPGDYIVRVIAGDAAGNETLRDVTVRVAPPTP